MTLPTEEPPPVSRGWRNWSLRPVYVALRRAVVLCSIVIALYVIIGSCIFAPWWYGFFWDNRRGRLSYAIEGSLILVDEFFWLAFGILIALIVVIVVGRLLKHHLFKAIDSAPWVILVCIWLAVAADALILRHTEADNYTWETLEESHQKIKELGTPPKIVAPVYFYYVDTNRVDSLYNQLEPELEVKEHEVTGKSTLKANATAGVGETTIGVEAGSENGTKSTYSPAKLLTDRKCVDVMRYVHDTWPENYFDRMPEWQTRMIYLGRTSDVPVTADVSVFNKRLGDRMQAELQSLHGYVFIEGDFDESISGNNVILVSTFAASPFKCRFRALLPVSASRMLPKTRPLHLTVFGDVTRPLRDDGSVNVIAIAVY